MIIFVAIALTLASIVCIAYPVIRPKRSVETVEVERLGGLHSQRENTPLAIEELKFDYEQGKLSLGDYQDLDQKYKRKATSILEEIDARGEMREPADEIEEEVMMLRRAREAAVESVACAQCGHETTRDARSCPGCGAPLPFRCSRCGATYEVGSRFCSWCGERLSSEGEA